MHEEEKDIFQQVMSTVHLDPIQAEEHIYNEVVSQHLQLYEDHFPSILDGNPGSTAMLWAIYLHLPYQSPPQTCTKTNDVSVYIHVFSTIVMVYCALNRPYYVRWGTLFLQNLNSLGPKLLVILGKGAFSNRRTRKHYRRWDVYLSCEQNVNHDAVS